MAFFYKQLLKLIFIFEENKDAEFSWWNVKKKIIWELRK